MLSLIDRSILKGSAIFLFNVFIEERKTFQKSYWTQNLSPSYLLCNLRSLPCAEMQHKSLHASNVMGRRNTITKSLYIRYYVYKIHDFSINLLQRESACQVSTSIMFKLWEFHFVRTFWAVLTFLF